MRGWSIPHSIIERYPALGAIPVDRTVVMGIVNTTPDSFSDGGSHFTADLAIAHARQLVSDGADIIDVGGESTRPGAAAVPPDVEQARILPVIEALSAEGVPVSVDTRHASTMRRALAAGAVILNDVTALTHDAQSFNVAATAGCPAMLMHMQGTPQTMQAAPEYQDVVGEVTAYLAERAGALIDAGIPTEAIVMDPGIGFGKTLAHNGRLLAATDRIASLGHPVLIGVSRKSFVAKASRGEPVDQRLPGSIAAMTLAVERGASIVRVHDVAETVQALAVLRAVLDPDDT